MSEQEKIVQRLDELEKKMVDIRSQLGHVDRDIALLSRHAYYTCGGSPSAPEGWPSNQMHDFSVAWLKERGRV